MLSENPTRITEQTLAAGSGAGHHLPEPEQSFARRGHTWGSVRLFGGLAEDVSWCGGLITSG